MKILAIEKEIPGIPEESIKPFLKPEAARVWQLQQEGILREIYFRADISCAVLILECEDVIEADKILQTLPLVKKGKIAFDIIPLIPYPGFSRLFEQQNRD
ncbi:superoxide dismutase [candidate division KSB1 bacterium]|nr:superoxide dismutase [candidate division KSB1 bacterium]